MQYNTYVAIDCGIMIPLGLVSTFVFILSYFSKNSSSNKVTDINKTGFVFMIENLCSSTSFRFPHGIFVKWCWTFLCLKACA